MAVQDSIPRRERAAAARAATTFTWKYWLLIALGITVGVALISGVAFVIGVQFGSQTRSSGQIAESPADTTWTCAMHPQVKLPKPGKCPICFMDLIPLLATDGGSGHPRELKMTQAAMALSDIQTSPVRRQFVTNTIRMVGKVDYDETKLAYITAWVPGRLDRLYIDYTGVTVRKGDHLVEMYSPDLIVAQRELIQATKNYQRFANERDDPSLATTRESAEKKLRLLGLTDQQIDDIKRRDTPTDHVTIYAPIGGVVVHKNANEGMNVQMGTRLYTIADLSQVWVYMDAYESDVSWLRYGQEVEFTTETYPGEIFTGRVSFIDPILDERTRTVRVRVNVPNDDRRLKPGMFVRALVKSKIAEGGQVIDAAMAGKWVSPHHPEIVRDGPGKCPICGIDLVPAEELGFVTPSAGADPPLVIPASAPLLTGKRAVVYVKVPDADGPTFQGREVLLGPRVSPPAGSQSHGYDGDYYIVRHGLSEGEEVVINGNFKIDSALQIAAKPSMMSPDGGSAGEGHQHHGDPARPATTDPHAGQPMAQVEVPGAFRLALNPVYTAYLQASEALAVDDLATARRQFDALLNSLKQIGLETLDEDVRSRWKVITDEIVFATHAALDAQDRQAAREHFEHLSNSILLLIQTFGHALDQPLYQFHCLMAFKNKGATWLQAGSQTRNPYFGPSMLECGEPMATFLSQAPLVVPAPFRRQLSKIYDEYLKLQTELAADQPQRAAVAVGSLLAALGTIDDTTLDRRATQAWLLARKQLVETLEDNPQQPSLDELRKRFEGVSLTMLGIVDNFGQATGKPLFKAYCPMAFDNQGAPWLQSDQKIANPYFGSEMFGCGSIKRTYEPVQREGDVQP